MGCGGSKSEAEDEIIVPNKLRPLLRKRFEEIRRLRHATTLKDHNNLSKKMLLKDGSSDDDNFFALHSLHEDDHKSFSSQEDSLKVAPVIEPDEITNRDKIEETLMVLPSSPKLCKDVEVALEFDKLGQEKNTKEGDKDGEEAGEDLEMETMALAMAEVVEVIKRDQRDLVGEEEDTDEDHEYGRLSNAEERCICPGSPSFRVYFIESLTNTIKDNDKDNDVEKKSLSEDSTCQETIESVKSNEDKVTNIKKKGKRAGIKFRKVIPKKKLAAMRNLLNVTSCYNPACSGLDKSHLLAQKAVS